MTIVIKSIATPRGVLVNATAEEALEAGASPADIAAALGADRLYSIKTECRRRIYAVASAETQTNMASVAAVIGAKTATARTDAEKGQVAAFGMALEWVQAMRGAAQTLAADAEADFAADARWPACPAEVVALAASF